MSVIELRFAPHMVCGREPAARRSAAAERCARCRRLARRVHLLVLSGHSPTDVAHSVRLTAERACAAFELQERMQTALEAEHERALAAWLAAERYAVAAGRGPMCGPPVSDPVEVVDAARRAVIAAWGPIALDVSDREVCMLRAGTHIPTRLLADRVEHAIRTSSAGVHAAAGCSHAAIAAHVGIDERLFKRHLGLAAECERERGGHRYGGRHRRAVSAETAIRVARAIGLDPVDVPGL